MNGPVRLVAGLLFAALAGVHAPVSALELAPGQAFDRTGANRLLAPVLARAAGAEQVRVLVEEPRLPLGNPYPEVAELAVTRARPTADDRFVASVRITVGDRTPLELALKGRFKRLVGVPVPRAKLAEGHVLEADDVETRWLTAARVRGEWVGDAGALVGLEAHRALLAGRPVPTDAVGSPRLVRRGERVTLVVAEGGLRLEASGTARGDAGRGEAVEVKNDRSGTIVTGRVRAAGRVHVETR